MAVVQVPWVDRSPYTSSVSEVMVSTSLEVLVTFTEKVKVPPGSVRLAGVTSLTTWMTGTGVMSDVSLASLQAEATATLLTSPEYAATQR